jgi:hypothetical protein
MKLARWNDGSGKVISEQVGRVLVELNDGRRVWKLRGVNDLEIYEQRRGRPRLYSDNAQKQRAYRERVKDNPLRKYERGI